MHTIHLIEPSWWISVLNWWINVQSQYWWIWELAPVFADIFVIIYPIFLILIYIYAIIKKKVLLKQWALYIFFVTFFAVLINIWIQCFFYKERPIVALNQVDTWETLLHDILPVSSFPSDHAVVSMTFAMMTLLWWIFNKKKFFIFSGIVMVLISLLMTICRVLTLVHWPSDIVAWLLLWIFVSLLFMVRSVRYLFLRNVINPVIRFEQWLVKKIFHYNQWNV